MWKVVKNHLSIFFRLRKLSSQCSSVGNKVSERSIVRWPLVAVGDDCMGECQVSLALPSVTLRQAQMQLLIKADYIKLMKGKALRKHSVHGKTAASVLLKLYISGNERCHTTDAPSTWAELLFSNVNNIHSMIPEDHWLLFAWCVG